MAHELYAQAFAKLKNQTITEFLGKGHFGEAYLTSANTVLKVTKDHCETLAALKMIGHQHDNVVDIYNVQKLPNELFIIEQQYLDHNSDADMLYWQLRDVADHAGVELDELIAYEPDEIIAETELVNYITQLKAAMDHLNSIGIKGAAIDMASDNFAIDNGHITVFDNRFDSFTKIKALDVIKQEFPELYAQTSDNEYAA